MVKLGLIQTRSYSSNQQGIKDVGKSLRSLGKKEVDVVCMPEQWLKNNVIEDYNSEFSDFKKIAKDYSMTVIPGAFYEKNSKNIISSPIISDKGEIIGKQEKIHPFDYEKKLVRSGKKTNTFKTKCKFGIVICYDMVFPEVCNSLVRKGAEVLFSPSRIIRRGINPWHLYVQVRALENRVPILAANVENRKFGGNSIIVSLISKNGIIIPKIESKLIGKCAKFSKFNLGKLKKSRKVRFEDSRKFI